MSCNRVNRTPDFLIVGAGIIGLCLARELKARFPDASITILEKDNAAGMHASGRNSGVLHAGFYYTADSLKAKLCRDGNRAWQEYCQAKQLKLNQCGKLVVARNAAELQGLKELLRRGQANGVELEMISSADAIKIEPNVNTYERALWSPATATVAPEQIVESICNDILADGVIIKTGTAYVSRNSDKVITSKETFSAGYVINTAGLYADEVARDYGFSEHHKILPFKGLYLYASKNGLKLNTNVYPVPDLKNPFLGVHFTVTADNRTKIGPTAIPAFWRENYTGVSNFNLKELIDIVGIDASLFLSNDFGFRQLAFQEIQKYSRKNLVRLAGSLLNKIDASDFVEWGRPGIRAQLINSKTKQLEMDFKFEGDDRSFHVLNAVSPAFTCAMPFSELLASEISRLTG